MNMKRQLVVTTVMLVIMLVVPVVAMAAGSGNQVGENLGNMLGGWAKSLYAGIAGIVAVVFLFNRRFAELAVFVGAAIVVGGFVLSPGTIAGLVKDIWQTLAG